MVLNCGCTGPRFEIFRSTIQQKGGRGGPLTQGLPELPKLEPVHSSRRLRRTWAKRDIDREVNRSTETLLLLFNFTEINAKSWFKLYIQKTNIMASGPITSWQIEGKQWKQGQVLFSWAPKSLQTVTAAMKLKDTCSLEGKLWQT